MRSGSYQLFVFLPMAYLRRKGSTMYRHMYSAEEFSREQLLDSLNISSEHETLELADKVEAYESGLRSIIEHV